MARKNARNEEYRSTSAPAIQITGGRPFLIHHRHHKKVNGGSGSRNRKKRLRVDPRTPKPFSLKRPDQLPSLIHPAPQQLPGAEQIHILHDPRPPIDLKQERLVLLDASTAAIRRTLQRTSAGGLTTLPTKTRTSERRIALPTRCVQSLKLHYEQQKCEHEAAGTTWQHEGHVFTTAQGRPIDPTNLTRTFTMLLRTAGLRRIRFHDLRHSTATVYAHVRIRLQRDAIDLLGHALDRP